MAKEAGAQADPESAKNETLTGDEGKNLPDEKKVEKKVDEQTPEQKAAADKKVSDDAAAAAKKKTDDDAAAKALKDKGSKDGEKPKAPDKYELSLPEDAGDYLDDSDLKTVEQIARAKGWTNDEAQAALEEHADTLAKQSLAFRAETEKDETYGGDNLVETQRLARLALDKVRPANTPQGKALRRILAKSGYGNKLEVVSFLADLGKLMAEDRPGGGGGGSKGGGEKDAGEVLYGGTPIGS